MFRCPKCNSEALAVVGKVTTEYHDAEIEFNGVLSDGVFHLMKAEPKGSYYMEEPPTLTCMRCKHNFLMTSLMEKENVEQEEVIDKKMTEIANSVIR